MSVRCHAALIGGLMALSTAIGQDVTSIGTATGTTSTTTGIRTQPKARQPAPPGAGIVYEPADVQGRITTAKAAEEGDGDLRTAYEEYVSVVREFDERRPTAAEALFRSAELAEKLGRTEEARLAYSRILREFTDLPELARPSLERLTGVQFGATPEGRTHSAYAAHRATGSAGVIVPRIGSFSWSPGTTIPGWGGASAEMSREPGTTSIERPPDGRPGWYGAVGAESAELHELDRDLDTLRQEARELGGEQRRIERELRAARSAGGVSKLPTRFITDPNLIEMISRIEQVKGAVDSPGGDSSEKRKEKLDAVLQLEIRLQEYFEGTYIPRLESSVKLLDAELSRLEAQISDLQNKRSERFKRAADAASGLHRSDPEK